ncbi:probable LRR receptor-like serine/threonine-protein kinase at3g47570 [Phtheirospermum japonicum]|uniref:non-specific serine/threonine protein kinase n=1 Tax=Phtheirospermum japonicum TaxID=374723 RepID=A0A830B2G7_9LAMI|nr:probable LRR receptor-like serine/threonine-protein kinase at3g47570 [Phtheirospermum japonicum]
MCNNLPNLATLGLSGNQIEGQIPPNIWKCRELQILSLSINRFNGEIPSEIGSLSMLRELYLGVNDFIGLIPKEIGNCTSLKRLVLSYNHLTGELPRELGHLSFLEAFSVSNNSLSGSIPSSIFNISTLKVLQFSFNQFSGSLPLKLSLFNLEELFLDNNELNGKIPSSITNSSKLISLQLTGNAFSGSIPNFGNLRLLQNLFISGNNLSGAEATTQELRFLSSLTNCQHLKRLEIARNLLNGVLPASIGNLSATSLQSFFAFDCNIKGVIPSTIGNLSSLLSLSLVRNQLTGFIPPTMGKLKQLQGLFLSENQLQGSIPPDLCGLSHIVSLYMNDNLLTGPIPRCLGDVRSLRNVNLGSNKLNSSIPSNFWNLRDLLILNLSSNYLTGQLLSQIASLKVIGLLDLSHNKFSGDIPSTIDSSQSLEFLSLSDNNLVGPIPPSLGNIKGLIILDLSHNNLSGTIPDSLEGLSLLQYFNVSYNNLEGEIPTGVIILASIIVVVLTRRRKYKRVPVTTGISVGVTWRRISYVELVRGTDAFSETNLLGKGGFGSVFKGTLSDGLIVAVKVFNLQLERVVRSFDTECEILSNVRHRNLVPIIGCCSNKEFKALIFGYMQHGSLEKWLYSENSCLDMIRRLQIAIDVALALEYLHHGHTFPVVHCDIKPSNVLFDEDMVAHLADFGISKLFDDGETMVQTKTLPTIEYGSEGKVSTNGDVYSYGILLLEIFTRKKPTDDMFSEEMSLKEWVHKALQENAITEVVAPDLLAREEQHFSEKLEECVSSIFSLAMRCLAVSPDERINMIEIVATLHRTKAKVVVGTERRQQYALSITAGQ